MKVRAVVFDLDGTLIDSAPDLHAAVNCVLEEEGRRKVTLDQVKSMIGNGVRVLVERAFAATGNALGQADSDARTRRFHVYYDGDAFGLTRLYPGAEAVLRRLTQAGVVLGLCTNKPHQAVAPILASLGIDGYFKAVLGGDAIAGVRKPDRRHVLGVLDALGVAPGDAVMVGDSPVDVAAGRNAGVKVIAVSFGYPLGPLEDLGADTLIDDFAELEGAIERL